MAATNRVRGGHRTAGLWPLENLARLKIVPSKTFGYEVLIDGDDRPRLLDYLGSSYRQRFSHSGDVKDLDMALKHTLEAVAPESTPLAPADRSIFFNA